MRDLEKLKTMRKDFEEIKSKLLGLEKRGRLQSLVITKIEEAVHWLDDLLHEAEAEAKNDK